MDSALGSHHLGRQRWKKASARAFTIPSRAGLHPDFSLPDLDIPSKKQPEQPEFVRTPDQYLNEKTLANLAEQGRQLFAQYKDTLIAIKKTYQIDPYILLAVWGRETAFGTYAHDSAL